MDASAIAVLPLLLQAASLPAQVKTTAYARVPLARTLARDPAVVQAVLAANRRPETMAAIQRKDAYWTRDRANPLRREILDRPCSARLRELVVEDATVVEAFAMDGQGALVCATVETSDYWQGDEAKWQKTFQEGREAFVEEPAFDASTGTYAIQLSVPLSSGGRRVGALTLTLKLSRQQLAQ